MDLSFVALQLPIAEDRPIEWSRHTTKLLFILYLDVIDEVIIYPRRTRAMVLAPIATCYSRLLDDVACNEFKIYQIENLTNVWKCDK